MPALWREAQPATTEAVAEGSIICRAAQAL